MTDPLPEILSPKNDFVFKMLFGDKRNTAPLAAFLQAALELPEEEFVDLVIEDPNLKRQYDGDKLSILDVRITTRSGKDVDVEIQVRPSDELPDRILSYAAQMVAEKATEGDSYRMPQSICIVIVDHRLWRDSEAGYHHRFALYEPKAKLEYPNSLEIHTLELPKLPANSDGTELWRWLKFISSKTREEFASLAGKDAVMTEALLKLMDMSVDKATRRAAEARAKWLWDDRARLRQSRREGLTEGLAEGLAKGRTEGRMEGRIEIVRRMVRAKKPFAEIAEMTGCSIAEIELLAAEG